MSSLTSERAIAVMSEISPVIERAFGSTGLFVLPPADMLATIFPDRRPLAQPVFTGGGIVGLLVESPSAFPISATKDLDLIIEVTSRVEFGAVEAALRRAGFRDCPAKPAIGRFLWSDENVEVEFHTPRQDITGFSDQWYPEVLRSAIRTRGIWHASAPAFIATKISAFLDGRRGDFYSSKDIEDILAVIDGRPSIVPEVRGADRELRHWLTQRIGQFLEDSSFLNAVEGHLPDSARARAARKRLESIAEAK